MAEYIEREAMKQALRNAHIYLNEEGVAVIEIEDIPSADVVSKAAYDQIAWERHLAEVQLKSIGKSIGEKMDDVQPVQWIPVTERLPDSDTEYVLCCGSKGGMFVGWAAIKSYDGSGKCTGFQNSGKGRNFTHWMPLPEPPKGGEDGSP